MTLSVWSGPNYGLELSSPEFTYILYIYTLYHYKEALNNIQFFQM